MSEIKRWVLAAKSFNTNLVQLLLPYHVIISNVHICSFTCMIFHVHRRQPSKLEKKVGGKKL